MMLSALQCEFLSPLKGGVQVPASTIRRTAQRTTAPEGNHVDARRHSDFANADLIRLQALLDGDGVGGGGLAGDRVRRLASGQVNTRRADGSDEANLASPLFLLFPVG